MNKILIVCTTDSMIWNFLIPHINELKKKYIVECACSETGDFFEKIKKEYNINMHKFNFKRSPYNFKNIFEYNKLKKFVKNNNFDIIFCHEPIGGVMGRLVGHKYKLKVIYMVHGFHFFKGGNCLKNCIYRNVEKFLSRYTNAIITINEEDFNAAKKMHAKRVYKVNGIGVDTNKFKKFDSYILRKELNLNDNNVILLSVGELINRKNHISIIKALEQINDKNIHYVIVGTGELKEKLDFYIANSNIKDNVHLVGYRQDISDICNSADIFVMPSKQEGLSVALMEAMSCGKPIIASKIRGNVDLIDDENGGLLVDSMDIEGYSKAILKLAHNKTLYNLYGNYNVNKVKLFDVKNVIIQLDTIYKEEIEEVL